MREIKLEICGIIMLEATFAAISIKVLIAMYKDILANIQVQLLIIEN